MLFSIRSSNIAFAFALTFTLLSVAGCGADPSMYSHSTDSFAPGTAGGDGGSGDGGTTNPPYSPNYPLSNKVEDLEIRLDAQFRTSAIASLVPNQLRTVDGGSVDSPNGFEIDDSALFTGVYLGSQCLKDSLVTNAGLHAATRVRISGLLDTIQRLRDVTGIRGLFARGMLIRGQGIEEDKVTCVEGDAWVEGTGVYSGVKWCGSTSRDQYTGLTFGLALCAKITGDVALRERAARMLLSLSIPLYDNGFTINYDKYKTVWKSTASVISGDLRAGIDRASIDAIDFLATRGDSTNAGYRARFDADLTKQYSLFPLRAIYENPWAHRFYDAFALNLSSLALYPLIRFETDAARRNTGAQFFWTNLWLSASKEKNSQFGFMKFSLMGTSTPSGLNLPPVSERPNETQSLAQSRESLLKLAMMDRNNSVAPKAGSACTPDTDLEKIRNFGEELYKYAAEPVIRDYLDYRIPHALCSSALDIDRRGYAGYAWEKNPYSIPSDEVGKGNRHSPAVDTIVAYWLGRAGYGVSPWE